MMKSLILRILNTSLCLVLCNIVMLHLAFAQEKQDNVATLKSFIKNEYIKAYPEMTIDSISLIARNSLKLYDITLLTKNMNSTKNANGYITITYRDNNRILQDTIRYTIQGSIKVYIANDNIRAGSNFNLNNLTYKIQDFSIIAIPPATKDEILHSSAKMYIPINSIIYRNKLAKKILVTKDSSVKILLKADGIEAISSGKALQNGARGDIISVENAESKRTINAEVIDDSVVRIK